MPFEFPFHFPFFLYWTNITTEIYLTYEQRKWTIPFNLNALKFNWRIYACCLIAWLFRDSCLNVQVNQSMLIRLFYFLLILYISIAQNGNHSIFMSVFLSRKNKCWKSLLSVAITIFMDFIYKVCCLYIIKFCIWN